MFTVGFLGGFAAQLIQTAWVKLLLLRKRFQFGLKKMRGQKYMSDSDSTYMYMPCDDYAW